MTSDPTTIDPPEKPHGRHKPLIIVASVFVGLFTVAVAMLWMKGLHREQQLHYPVSIPAFCKSTEELANFYSSDSKGGNVQVQTNDGLIFIQTFPFSGVRASHLYVHDRESSGFTFVCFYRLQTQERIKLKPNDNGTIDIRTNDGRIAIAVPPIH